MTGPFTFPRLLAIGCCTWLVALTPTAAAADPPDLAQAERSPVEAPRPRVVSLRESTQAAYEHLSTGDSNAARVVILAAIAANPNDAGHRWPKYVPPAGQNIPDSPELRAALKAMPELGELVERRPDVREWLSFAFSGFGSEPVVWEDAPPPYGWAASSGRNSDGKLAVRVARTTAVAGGPAVPKSGEELLSDLVFELFNVQNHGSFDNLHERARAGSISRDAFVAEKVDLEGDATELMRAFYANVLLSIPGRRCPLRNR